MPDGGDRLYSAIKEIAGRAVNAANTTDILFGTVKSVSPLSVAIENKFTLTSEQLELSQLCKRKVIQLVIPGDSGGGAQTLKTTEDEPKTPPSLYPHTHSVTVAGQPSTPEKVISVEIWRGLVVGDRVRVLKYNAGNSYFIMERIEG